MTSYGKKCKSDSDCYSSICEMTYKNKKPDTRRCVVKNNIEKISKKQNEQIEYGKECSSDSDCKSQICEPRYTNKDNSIEKGNFCVVQELKYGKKCSSNSDCESFRCKFIYNDKNLPTGRKCIEFKNQPQIENVSRSFGDIDDGHLPDYAKTDKWKHAKNEEIILSNSEKEKKLEGRGIIADIIIIIMEFIVLGIQTVLNLLVMGWKLIFYIVSFIPSLILKTRVFSFSDKYMCKDSSRCNTGSCDPQKSLAIKAIWLKKFMIILFPPYGLFLAKGISSIQQILVASVLTMMLYFPGVIYALSVIDEDNTKE